MSLSERLKAKAVALGFNRVGIVPAVPSPTLHHYLAWIAAEMHGQMGYLARPDRIIRREDLNVIVPNVQSIVCVGLDYYTRPVPDNVAHDPSRGRISNYAWRTDYHDIMTPKLRELGAWLKEQTDTAVEQKVYVDTGAILERSHAEKAGMGFTGKNTMLINGRGGSFFFLGELLTTIALEPDVLEPDVDVVDTQKQPSCGSCTRCLVQCPTAAFPSPYVLDARRCISYLTIELKGSIPVELRPLMGNWIYGCDVCQDVCPFNRFAVESERPEFEADDWDTAVPPLLDLLMLDEDGFNARFAHSPIKRIKRDRFVRNVCVAAGNWGDEAAVPALTALLDDGSALVREHAVWALDQL